jgi:hypothetical protein
VSQLQASHIHKVINLLYYIYQHAKEEFDSGDIESVLNIFNTPSILVEDNDLYTWAGIALVAGPEAAEMLRVALEQNNVGWAVHQFGGTGLQLTNPLVMQMITMFIQNGIPLQPLVDHVHNYISLSKKYFDRDLTEEDIHTCKVIELKKRLEDEAINRLQSFREALSLWDGDGQEPVL